MTDDNKPVPDVTEWKKTLVIPDLFEVCGDPKLWEPYVEKVNSIDRSQYLVMNNILVSICISIPAASLFLPLLIDYGLVDFVGVIFRPVMRPVFELPGRAAVITISAFLGNFSVGHIAVNDQYRSGRMQNHHNIFFCQSK